MFLSTPCDMYIGLVNYVLMEPHVLEVIVTEHENVTSNECLHDNMIIAM